MFRRAISRPLLKCVDEDHTEYVLNEVHRRICQMHTRGRSMATRVIRVGYYWVTLRVDNVEYIKTYKECQEFNNVHHAPPEALHNMTSPWPFAMWGINILGPFTKWIEVEPFATITTQKVQKFTWKHIIYRYDLPQAIVMNNERQFN